MTTDNNDLDVAADPDCDPGIETTPKVAKWSTSCNPGKGNVFLVDKSGPQTVVKVSSNGSCDGFKKVTDTYLAATGGVGPKVMYKNGTTYSDTDVSF